MALKGLRVIEMAGLAPAPFCGMILSDFGSNVIRVDKAQASIDVDRLCRGKRSIAVDLKNKNGINIVKNLCSNADVFIEPYRKGVMEKLGIGPEVLMEKNPKLIYARLTGFGQDGPFSKMAGHDINYIALSGILSTIGRKHENPLAPINLLADFAGGGMICALGICMALLERAKSGKGQVIDANMVEGSAYIGAWLWKSADLFVWGKPRGENVLDTGSHFYETYRTKDNKFVAVGALEPQFYASLLKGLNLMEDDTPQEDSVLGNQKFVRLFATKTRDEWMALFEGTDACVAPVLDLNEAPLHPHNINSFVKNREGGFEPKAAPRLSRTPAEVCLDNPTIGQHTKEILLEIGYSLQDVAKLQQDNVITCSSSNSKL